MSEYTIEGLIIEVEADANEASTQLTYFTHRLEAFKTAVGKSTSLGTFAKNLDKLTVSIAKASTYSDFMPTFANMVNALAGLNQVKLSSTISKELYEIAKSIAIIPANDLDKVVKLTNGLLPLAQLNGVNLKSGIATTLQKIAELSKNLKGADFTKIRELTEALTPLGQLAGVDGVAMNNLASSVKKFATVTNSASKHGKTFNTVLANIRTKTLAAIYAMRKVVSVVTTSLDVYGDYIETLNLFSVSMGESAEKAYEYATTVQDALGIDLTQWMKAQGVFQTLAKGFGIATDRATIMSQQLTQLAYDISSFYNITVEDAIQKVQSAFSGELEPVRRLGYDLSQARLQAIALSLGIDENVSSMTQAEKASLRYYAMLTQVTDAQGDLARTLESPTNQMRIFNAQLNQLTRSIGQLFIPVLNKVLPYLNAMVQVLKWIIDEIAALFGYTLPGIADWGASAGVVDGVGDIGDAIDDTTGKAQELKNTLASFDEINLIGSKSGGGSGSGNEIDLGGGFDFDLPQYDFLGEATENRAKKIAENIKKVIAPAVEKLKDAIMFIRNNWDSILNTAKVLIGLIAGVKLYNKLKNIGTSLKEIDKTAAGLTLMLAGLTISFAGGQAVANGDYFKGVLEASLGTALAAVGGVLMFGGAAGLGIGIFAGITMYLMGFQLEEQAKMKEQADAIFFAIDEGKMSLQDFVNVYNDFVSDITSNYDELKPVFDEMSEQKIDMSNTITNMGQLIEAFESGKISVDDFAQSINDAFEGLKTSLNGYFENIKKVVEKEMSGALASYMLDVGVTLNQMEALLDKSQGNYLKAIESEQSYMKQLEDAYKHQYITLEEYQKGTKESKDRLSELFTQMATDTEAFKEFNLEISKGVNINGLDDAVGAIDQIDKLHNDTLVKLEAERKELTEMFEMAKLAPGLSDEDIAQYDLYIQQVDKMIDDQIDKVDKKTGEMLSVIGEQVSGKWAEVYDVQGFGAALYELQDRVVPIAQALNTAFSRNGITEFRTDSLQALADFAKAYEEAINPDVEGSTVATYSGELIMQWQRLNGIINTEVQGATMEFFRTYADNTRLASLMTATLNDDVNAVKLMFGDMLSREDGEKNIRAYFEGLLITQPQYEAQIRAFAEKVAEKYDLDLSDLGKMTAGSFASGLDAGTEAIITSAGNIGNIVGNGYYASIDIGVIEQATQEFLDTITDTLAGGDESIMAQTSNILGVISGVLEDPDAKVTASTNKMVGNIMDAYRQGSTQVSEIAEQYITEFGNTFVQDDSVNKDVEGWLDDIHGAMDKKSGIFKGAGDAIRNTIITAANAVGTTSFNAFGGDVVDTIGGSITKNKGKLEQPSKMLVDSMLDAMMYGMKDVEMYGINVVDTIGVGMDKGAKSVELKKSVDAVSNNIYTELTTSFGAMTDYGYNAVLKVVDGLENQGANNKVKSAAKGVGDTVGQEFDHMSDDILKTVTDMLKKLTVAFNTFKITGQFTSTLGNMNQMNIPGFANGGFPQKGNLFIANENGIPEYIGTMGGKNAVANNAEIVKGVSDGVYRAIKETGIAQALKVIEKKENTTVFAPSKEAGKVMSSSVRMYNGVGGRYQ